MREELVSLETAKIAKDKGFDWNCRNFFNTGGVFNNRLDGTRNDNIAINHNHDSKVLESYSAPSQSLLQKWLRKKHHINVWVRHVIDGYYICELTFLSKYYKKYSGCEKYFYNLVDTHFEIYEEALEDGLQKGLKLIK